MLLSAALIVRDEGRVLGDCLRALTPIAGEIIVVDTGSTDNTRQVAKDGGARLFEFAWIDDYAAARNEALRHCRGEWILSVDADERYLPCRRETLADLLGDPTAIAYSTMFRIRAGFTPYRRIRLFRNHPLIRFEGIIHENVLGGINRYLEALGGNVGDSPLFADHVGYDGDQREKNRRNLPILLSCARREPERTIIWCHLANAYAILADCRNADRCWRQAVQVARNPKDPLDIYGSVAYLGLLEWMISRGEEAGLLLEEARERFPEDLHLLWLEGRQLMQSGDHSKAIGRFEELLAARKREGFENSYGNRADDSNHWFGYDERLFDVLPLDSLAACHFALGQYDQSLRYLGLLAEHQPQSRKLLLKKRLCAHLLGGAMGGDMLTL